MWTRRLAGTVLFLVGLEIAALSEASAGAATSPRLPVVLCDRAGIEPGHLVEARRQSERIMAGIGVSIEWIGETTDCKAPASLRSYVSMVIVPEYPRDWPFQPDSMGYAAVTEGPYPRAYAFLDLVIEFDRTSRGTPHAPPKTGVILGHVIAHELGHLLGQSHRATGIMRTNWGHDEWMAALGGAMLFSRPEKVRRPRTSTPLRGLEPESSTARGVRHVHRGSEDLRLPGV
jgi:hypothetical protein